jgi:hypothetical protein
MEDEMTFYVRMTDNFMSGWGPAKDKKNVLVVECDTLEQAEQIERAAQRRAETPSVMICSGWPSSRAGIHYSWKHYDEMGGPWLQ